MSAESTEVTTVLPTDRARTGTRRTAKVFTAGVCASVLVDFVGLGTRTGTVWHRGQNTKSKK
jgi:hypothetical protein